MKKIVIAPDSFKESISARDAALAIADGLEQRFGDDVLPVILPIADGGEGTLDAIVPKNQRISATVKNHVGKEIFAEYGYVGDAAFVEMASACGLILTTPEDRSAGNTTTYGVGQLILHAVEKDFRKIVLTVGGSATNDGGAGMMSALGMRFLDADGKNFLPTGLTLDRIASVDLSGLPEVLRDVTFTIATDVKNPMVGDEGATRIYAKQKGATAEELDAMEAGMRHYANCLKTVTGKDVSNHPGCGAGGAIAAPLLALFDAQIRSGIDTVLEAVRFHEQLEGAFAVITGEGKLDRQSLYGKTISGVVKAAKEKNLPVYCLVGCCEADVDWLSFEPIRGVKCISDVSKGFEDSMKNAGGYLMKLARELF